MTNFLNYKQLCQNILQKDNAIRFVGVVTVEGNIMAAEYRKGLTPLLTQKESELSIMQSVIKANIRTTLESKLGKTIYSFTEYQKIKRASFVMYNAESLKCESILLLSFDREADHNSIIENKIRPLLKEIGKGL